jgi:hypothetical protein
MRAFCHCRGGENPENIVFPDSRLGGSDGRSTSALWLAIVCYIWVTALNKIIPYSGFILIIDINYKFGFHP